MHCFGKLTRPRRIKNGRVTMNDGSFVCMNNNCIAKYKVLSRDQVSAFVIDLAGLLQVLFDVTFSCFNPKATSYKTKKKFHSLAFAFCI